MQQIVNIDGTLFPPDEAKISIFDHGFLYGDNVYETMRTYGRRVFVIDRHMQRLQNSAQMLRLTLPLSAEDFKAEVERSIAATENQECYVRLIVTRGVGKIGLDMDRSTHASYIIIVNPFEAPPAQLYEQGIKVAIVAIQRNNRQALNPGIKSGNLLNNVLAYMQAKEQHAFEGILCNANGYITEATSSNVFAVMDGRLLTPPLEAGLLPGVTRALTLEFAAQKRIQVQERNMTPEELMHCDEAFITGTTKGILPIGQINDVALSPVPGPVTRGLMNAYRKRAQSEK